MAFFFLGAVPSDQDIPLPAAVKERIQMMGFAIEFVLLCVVVVLLLATVRGKQPTPQGNRRARS